MVTARNRVLATLVAWGLAATAHAQITESITGFETDRDGNALLTQPGSFGDLEVVVFQDPREADVTSANIVTDAASTNGTGGLRSSEESFVADFTGDGFFGAGGSIQFLDIRFEWVNPADPNRWVLVESLQSPIQGDPSLHLTGIVRMKINFPACAVFEFPMLTQATRIGVALLVRETGNDVPQGLQDNNPDGDLEFVGVDSVAGAGTASPVPVPSTYFNITDGFCDGSGWVDLTFDLDALESAGDVIGWSFRGGDGVLDATTNGDLVNRGVLAGLVLTADPADTTSGYVEFLVDNLEFDAPVGDPTFAPRLGSPILQGQTTVRVNDVLSSSTDVQVEIDRAGLPVGFTETYNVNPAGALFVDVPVTALGVGDQVRARQTNPAGVSDYSLVLTVNPAAVFSLTFSLDENGNAGVAPADFEFVGAAALTGGAPQGKPVFVQNGVWQNVEFSLIPGVEPVIDFAGGNGLLQPDNGSYNVDALWFTIDPTDPSTGRYNIFVDRAYVVDAFDNELVLANADPTGIFGNPRGQSTAINLSSTIPVPGLASYDGALANRLAWDFPDTALTNTCSMLGPRASPFADTAKAMGVWLLVEDARTNGLPLPAVGQPLYGDVPFVTVSNINSNAELVEVLANGVSAGSLVLTPIPTGLRTENVPVPGTLAVGDSISARYDTASDTSDLAFARVVFSIPAPAVGSPLIEGQTVVTVNNLLTLANATATTVRVYSGLTQIGSAAGGTASVNVSVPALIVGAQISATQVVNGSESPKSLAEVVAPAGCPPKVVINEIQYDDSGADDREFVELYNAEAVAVDISGWRLRSSDTVAPPGDNNDDYTIPASTVLASGDYYVLGAASVPNVDQIVTSANAEGLWENSNEAIQLQDPIGVTVDTVIYELNRGVVAVSPAEGGIWGRCEPSADATATKPSQSFSRWFNGYDTDNNGRDFGMLPLTPGASNEIASLAPYTDNFNTGVNDADVANFTGSFVNAKYIDPTVVSTYNRYAIPVSPDGGKAISVLDTTGGGNTAALRDAARFNVAFSCQVYLDPSTSPFTAAVTTNELEGWSIGIGMVDSLHTFNNIASGTVGANADTGLVWEYFKFEDAGNAGLVGGQFLLLKNENDGGDDGATLFTVPSASLTTGWHTLTLSRNYENWSASFDAINTNGVTAGNGPGSFYVGYREGVANFPNPAPGTSIRPPTIDALNITAPAAPTLGACCTECSCQLLTAAECTARSGDYAGDGSDCADLDLDGVADDCGALTPAATVTAAVARKSNAGGPGGNCDLPLIPVRKSESRQGGVTELRITFDVPPGGPGLSPATIEQATCAAPAFVPYSGASVMSAGIQGNDLVLGFVPGLENARTYRLTVGSEVTAILGQTVEVRGLVGDVNGDGSVNAIDRSTLVGIWTGAGFSCATDVNSSGSTNATDRSITVGAWTGADRCAP